MRAIVFDSGPIITLAMNSLLPVLKHLHEDYGGSFVIPSGVKQEIIDKPLTIKRFKFEALRVLSYLNKGIITINKDPKMIKKANELSHIANHIFKAHGKFIKIVHHAEMEAVALACELEAEAIVIDERTTRILIEDPQSAKQMLERKLHTPITMNEQKLKEFSEITKGLRVVRSTELATIAFEHGILDDYLPKTPHARKTLLESVLWGLKLNGCAIIKEEIDYLVKSVPR